MNPARSPGSLCISENATVLYVVLLFMNEKNTYVDFAKCAPSLPMTTKYMSSRYLKKLASIELGMCIL